MGKRAKSCFCKAKWRTWEKGPMVVWVTTSNSDLLDLKSWRKPDRLPVWRSQPPCVTSASKPAHNRWSTVAHVPGALVDVRLKKGRKSWLRAEPERVSACRSILRGQTEHFYPRGPPHFIFLRPPPTSKDIPLLPPKGLRFITTITFTIWDLTLFFLQLSHKVDAERGSEIWTILYAEPQEKARLGKALKCRYSITQSLVEIKLRVKLYQS